MDNVFATKFTPIPMKDTLENTVNVTIIAATTTITRYAAVGCNPDVTQLALTQLISYPFYFLS